jgi:hypothetical protein
MLCIVTSAIEEIIVYLHVIRRYHGGGRLYYKEKKYD